MGLLFVVNVKKILMPTQFCQQKQIINASDEAPILL